MKKKTKKGSRFKRGVSALMPCPHCVAQIRARALASHIRWRHPDQAAAFLAGKKKEKADALAAGGVIKLKDHVIVFPATVAIYPGRVSDEDVLANNTAEAITAIERSKPYYVHNYGNKIHGHSKWEVSIGGYTKTAEQWLNILFKKRKDEVLAARSAQQLIADLATAEDKGPASPLPYNLISLKGKTQADITMMIERLLDDKGMTPGRYSIEELKTLRLYEAHGGLAKKGKPIKAMKDVVKAANSPNTGVLDEYYTPYSACSKMWGLAYHHGFNAGKPNRILEPACGIGRLLEFVPNTPNQIIDAYEVSRYAWMICRLTMNYPGFNFFNYSFENMFFQNNQHTGISAVKYDLVIGNPPFRTYASEMSEVRGLAGKTEKQITLATTFDQYMMMRGVDVLVPGGLLIFILPNTFMSNDSAYNDYKDLLFRKADLLDAYRLPDIFPNTNIGTDLVVLKKRA